jgi:hypothetical protein
MKTTTKKTIRGAALATFFAVCGFVLSDIFASDGLPNSAPILPVYDVKDPRESDTINQDFLQLCLYAIKKHGTDGSKWLKANGVRLDPKKIASFQYQRFLQGVVFLESLGTVGIPNFLYLPFAEDPKNWPTIWQSIKDGKYIGKRYQSGPYKGQGSKATGLGQFLPENIENHYPEEFDGMGEATNEAFGCMSYLEERYNGDPLKAWEHKEKTGNGNPAKGWW